MTIFKNDRIEIYINLTTGKKCGHIYIPFGFHYYIDSENSIFKVLEIYFLCFRLSLEIWKKLEIK